MKETKGLGYPFIHRVAADDDGGAAGAETNDGRVYGTLITWPADDAESRAALFDLKVAQCNDIEGFNPASPDDGEYRH